MRNETKEGIALGALIITAMLAVAVTVGMVLQARSVCAAADVVLEEHM